MLSTYSSPSDFQGRFQSENTKRIICITSKDVYKDTFKQYKDFHNSDPTGQPLISDFQ